MSAFTFDGVSSATFNAVVFEKSLYETPAKNYEIVPIPGRNGNLLLWKDRYDDVTMSYTVLFTSNFESNYSALRNYLLSRDGYCRLSDTFNTDEFYLAYYSDVMQPTITRDHNMGKVTIRFQRRAERFLTSGDVEQEIHLTGSTPVTITNPTMFVARPLIRMYGYQDVTIAGTRFEVYHTGDISTPINIDCEIMECFDDTKTIDANQFVKLKNGALEFPKLLPGANTLLSEVGGRGTVNITPRWWKL